MAGAGPILTESTTAKEATSAARQGLGLGQGVIGVAFVMALAAGLVFESAATVAGLMLALQIAFLTFSFWRLTLMSIRRPRALEPDAPQPCPRYTVMAALYHEVEVLPQLIGRLSLLDYPADRLEVLLLLEADDEATIRAATATDRPDWIHVVIVPPGSPKTKPRALNHGLALATGDLITVYDAEDDPDPLQLREAAGRFAADGNGRLGCLQAPLRIRRLRQPKRPSRFLDRQFAVEYAALFEVTLPAMAAMGLPFPLGGTSNHFRANVLRSVGGWDAWNVTEDADLGFRLWRQGWRLGVIARPTWESPPGGFDVWLPQRTRWLKGFMQTWIAHTRHPGGLTFRGITSLGLTVGATILSGLLYAPTMALIVDCVIYDLSAGRLPSMSAFSLTVLSTGVTAALLHGALGARRAGVAFGPLDMIRAPFYWCLLSLAWVHAFWRLIREPFAWDKTPHLRDDEDANTNPAVGITGETAVSPTATGLDAGRQPA